jgi:hypothetical protein
MKLIVGLMATLVGIVSIRTHVQEKQGVILVWFRTSEDTSGFLMPEAKERRDTVEDLRHAIQNPHRISAMRLAPSEGSADVIIDVLGRARGEGAVSGALALPNGAGGFTVLALRRSQMVINARVKVGDFEGHLPFTSESRSWTQAAADAAEQLQRWVKDNRAKILTYRKR